MALQEKKKESSFSKELTTQKKDVEKAIENILNAIEQGVFTKSTKGRLTALEEEKEEIELAISREKSKNTPLTREAVSWFLTEIKNEKKDSDLMRSFVNAVYINDDEITVAFNYVSNEAVWKYSKDRSDDSVLVTHGRLERPTP